MNKTRDQCNETNWKTHKYVDIQQHTLDQSIKGKIKRKILNNLRQMKLKKENTECAKAVLMLVLRKWETSQINNLALNLYLGEIEKQHTKQNNEEKNKEQSRNKWNTS